MAEKLIIGIKAILDQRRQLHGGNVQRKPAVLNAREFEQLLDHFGKASRFAGDDLDAAARVAPDGLVVGEGFRPAGDGGERRAQLVGNGGDELRLHTFCLRELLRHIVDRVGQLSDLVVVRFFHLRAVASFGDAAGNARERSDRLGDRAQKVEI